MDAFQFGGIPRQIACGVWRQRQREGAVAAGILNHLTPRRLRGGVKIRASEFLGGGGTPSIIVISPPPATASRSHPPPQAAEGKNSFFVKKRIPIPAKAGISPTSNCFGRDVKRQLEIRGDSRFRGNGRGGGNGREGENGRETGGGNGRGERQKIQAAFRRETAKLTRCR